MGILDAPSLVKLSDRDLLLGLQADRWDLFNRPNGTFTNGLVMPSGQVWVVTGAQSGSVLGPELKTLNRSLTYDNRSNPVADPKAYLWHTAAPITRYAATFSFGPGSTTNATIGFILSPKSTADTSGIPTSNGAPGVATNSIHGSVGPNSWSFLMFKAGVQSPVFASAGIDGTWATPLVIDQKYTIAIERLAVDAMRIWLPAARVGSAPRYLDITDALILSRSGVADKIADLWPETGVQSAVIEFFNPVASSATDRFGTFHAVACHGGGKTYAGSAVDAAAATGSLRTLGPGAQQAYPGDSGATNAANIATNTAAIKPVAGSNAWLALYAANPEALIVGAITRDPATQVTTSAGVAWPDGSADGSVSGTVGTYTATLSAAFPGAVSAYSVTYGSPVTKTATQPTMTRDPATGAVTNRPAMTVT